MPVRPWHSIHCLNQARRQRPPESPPPRCPPPSNPVVPEPRTLPFPPSRHLDGGRTLRTPNWFLLHPAARAQPGKDLAAGRRAVEGDEVDAGRALGQQLLRKLRRDLHPDLPYRVQVVLDSPQTLGQLWRELLAGEYGEAFD